uniref:Secreted protein n=1 Tax=Echinococcus granulosus TaxID=6210 RepID=A0A068X1X8_ECHGR|nr:hypothetical protein EgrG_000042400 [Echinococcus granulosus]
MDCFVCLTSLLCSFVCKSHSPFQPSVAGYASDFFLNVSFLSSLLLNHAFFDQISGHVQKTLSSRWRY